MWAAILVVVLRSWVGLLVSGEGRSLEGFVLELGCEGVDKKIVCRFGGESSMTYVLIPM